MWRRAEFVSLPTGKRHCPLPPGLSMLQSVTRVQHSSSVKWRVFKAGSTLVTLPRNVTPYRDSVEGTRDRVTNQKLVIWSRGSVTNF